MPSKNGHTPDNTLTPVISVEIARPEPVEGPSTVVFVALDQIDPNPWQPRQGEDDDHIQKLADSIAVDGLLQIPTARPVAVVMSGDRFQLAFGHSRLAAYKRLHAQYPDDPRFREFPLNLRNLTDRQMADAAARENVTRKDLSAIEIATAIQRYITDFGATQLEAGKIYGYTSQSSVSNLLRLLELPPAIREMVQAGKLPERVARALVLVSRFNADAAVKIAKKLTNNEGWTHETTGMSRRSLEGECIDAIDSFHRQNGKLMRDAIWEQGWPKKPMAVPSDLGLKSAPAEVPACTGCPFLVKGSYHSEYCMRPECFHAKGVLKTHNQVKQASQSLGIPVAKPGEKVKVIFAGGWNTDEKSQAQAALKSKHSSLRLVPKPDGGWEKNTRKEILGEEFVALATVDVDALQKDVKAFKPKEKLTPERLRRDYEQERIERAERKDRKYMLTHAAAPHFRKAMPANNALLALIAFNLKPDRWCKDSEYERERVWMLKQWQEADLTRRMTIIAGMLLHELSGDDYDDTVTPARYAEAIEAQAKLLNVRLPAKWSDAAINGPIPDGEERVWEVPEDFLAGEDDDDDWNAPWAVEATVEEAA